VEGLTTNLISISQLCEQGLNAHFSDSECTILKDQEVVMKGTKSKDKCCLWTAQNNSPKIACLSVKEEDIKMSHKIVQHLCSSKEIESAQTNKAKDILSIQTPKGL
jgi:hypothetical protein